MKNFAKIDIIEEVFKEDSVTLAITINGKKRDEIEVEIGLEKNQILSSAKEKVAKWLEGKSIIKEIYVPNKLINLVVK